MYVYIRLRLIQYVTSHLRLHPAARTLIAHCSLRQAAATYIINFILVVLLESIIMCDH